MPLTCQRDASAQLRDVVARVPTTPVPALSRVPVLRRAGGAGGAAHLHTEL
jgi:hypothetical protein